MCDKMGQNGTSTDGASNGIYPIPEAEPGPKKRVVESPEKGLTMPQYRAVEALMANASIRQAAAAAGVSRRTLHRWLRETPFQKALMRMQYDHINAAHASLQAVTGDAVEALRKVLNDPGTAYSVLVNASRTALTLGYELVEAEDVRYRLDRLERLEKASPYD